MRRNFVKKIFRTLLFPACAGLVVLVAIMVFELVQHCGLEADDSSFMAIIWGLLALVFGARAVPRSEAVGTPNGVHPISRCRAWWTSVFSRLGRLSVYLASTGLAAWGISAVCNWHSTKYYAVSSLLGPSGLVLLLGCFGAGMAVSAVNGRRPSAVLVAGALCVYLGFLIHELCSLSPYLLLSPQDMEGNLTIAEALFVPAFFVASYWAYTRGTKGYGLRQICRAGGAFSVALALTLGLAAGSLLWLSRFNRYDTNGTIYPYLSPDGRFTALVCCGQDYPIPFGNNIGRYCLSVHLLIQSVHQPVVRHILPGGTPIGWSGDGRNLLYWQDTGPLGTQLVKERLLWVDVLSGASRQLDVGDHFHGDGEAAWSPDGRWLAVRGWNGVRFFHGGFPGAGEEPLQPVAVLDFQMAPTAQFFPLSSQIVRVGVSWKWTSGDGRLITWGNDSHYLYLVQDGRLLALDPSRVPRPTGYLAPARESLVRNPQPGIYTLFSVQPGSDWMTKRPISIQAEALAASQSDYSWEHRLDLMIQLAGSHQALITLTVTEPAGPHWTVNNDGRLTFRRSFVVDLAAATLAAVQRSGSPPGLPAWLDEPSTASTTLQQNSRTAITPDGRYVLSTAPIAPGNDGGAGSRQPVYVNVSDVDHPHSPGRKLLFPAGLPRFTDCWLPDARSFVWTTDSALGVFDLSDGTGHQVLSGNHRLMGIDDQGNIVVPRQSATVHSSLFADLFNPIATISPEHDLGTVDVNGAAGQTNAIRGGNRITP